MAVLRSVVPVSDIHSALAALQERVIQGHEISEVVVQEAIKEDLARAIPISEVFLSKFVCSNRMISSDTILSIITSMQASMNEVLLSNPDLFAAYSKGVTLLSRELRRRSIRMHLV
jgi:plasmid maintenance system antidote protein VapI